MKKLFVILFVIMLAVSIAVPASAASVIKGELSDYLTLSDPLYADIRFPLSFSDYRTFLVCDASVAFPGQSGVAFIYSATIRVDDGQFAVPRRSCYSIYDPLTGAWSDFAEVPAVSLVFQIPVTDSAVVSENAFFAPDCVYEGRLASFIRKNVSTGVVDVFSDFGSFLPRILLAVAGLFYADGTLTLLGILSVAALAVSAAFLVTSLVVRYLIFRS